MMRSPATRRRTLAALAAALSAAATSAEAHTGIGSTSAFSAGFSHPFGGLDHLLAMVAVGLWAGIRGGPALWLWPVGFVGAMAVGGALGMAGLPMPFVEQGIVGSVIVLGLASALAFSPKVALGAAIVALAGLFHGHAHGTEVPADASGIAYAAGFALATALLHAAGVAATAAAARLSIPIAARAAGGLAAAAGVVLALGAAA